MGLRGAARTPSVPGPALVPQGSAKLAGKFPLRGAILRPRAGGWGPCPAGLAAPRNESEP
jgi:hypothetical protein